MLNSHQSTLKNLRMVAIVQKGEYLSTNSDGDISFIIQESFLSNISSVIWGETWKSNLYALKKLYVTDVPALLGLLIQEERHKELAKVENLLTLSKKGLNNLKSIFDQSNHHANIDSIHEDYLDTQISYIQDELGSEFTLETIIEDRKSDSDSSED